MPTDRKITEPADRNAGRINAVNNQSVAQFRSKTLSTLMGDILITLAVNGVDCWEEDGEIVKGARLPLDIRKGYLTLLTQKVLPTPKDVVESGEDGNVGLLKALLGEIDYDKKKDRLLAERQEPIEVEVSEIED